jgi:hypothetical protein
MKDTLFVLRPGFTDNGASYFCPFCAQVIGFLTYFPHVQGTLNIVELDFPRPRKQLVDLLGETNQVMPLLVLASKPVEVPHVTVDEANGHSFVKNAISIVRYLAATRGTPLPH